jgi:hypothetical protein
LAASLNDIEKNKEVDDDSINTSHEKTGQTN